MTGENRRDASILHLGAKKKTSTVTRRLLIDSRDAQARYYQPFHFTIKLDTDMSIQRFRDIQCVELKLASIPKVAGEQYVVLDIEELRDSNLDASNRASHEAFAVVYFDNSNLTAGAIKPMDKFFSQKTYFNPPIASMDRLTVTIRKPDGTIVSPSETGGIDTVSFLLNVTMASVN
jgi:hypothetical protein